MRKPVFAICEQQRCRSAHSDQRLCCSLPRKYNISSFYIRNFKPLASFCGCVGRFESYLVENPKDRFPHDVARIIMEQVEASDKMSRDMIKPTKWVCAQRRLRSAWASAQSDQSLRCVLSGLLRIQAFFMRTAKTRSDWADAQADLSLRLAHSHFVGFVMSRLKCWNSDPQACLMNHYNHKMLRSLFLLTWLLLVAT